MLLAALTQERESHARTVPAANDADRDATSPTRDRDQGPAESTTGAEVSRAKLMEERGSHASIAPVASDADREATVPQDDPEQGPAEHHTSAEALLDMVLEEPASTASTAPVASDADRDTTVPQDEGAGRGGSEKETIRSQSSRGSAELHIQLESDACGNHDTPGSNPWPWPFDKVLG